MPVWLSEADVRAILPIPDVISAMEGALSAYSSGQVIQPVRTVITVAPDAFYASMPALASTLPAMGAKLVTVFGGNPQQGLHSHLATILLLDPETGALQAVMDGRYITEIRTAAVSAVALRHLAGSGRGVLAIIGSGVQARSHIEALPFVRNFDQIRCWSPTPSNLQKFAQESHASPAASAEDAVRGADVIVLATSSADPVLRSDWVSDRAIVISVGACRPHLREIDPDLVSRSQLFVDARASALAESGDVVMGIREGRFDAQHIRAEIGEVICRPELAPQAGETKPIVFKALGLAVEDLAAARLAFLRATAEGKGIHLA